MRTLVSLGDLKVRYPGASLTLKLPNLDSGGVRPVAFRPTHRIETRLPDRRVIVDYARLLIPGRDDDITQMEFDPIDYWSAATPEDYSVLVHGYSVVVRPTFGYSHRSKKWWPVICPEPLWTRATIVATEVSYEPVEETLDTKPAPAPVIEEDGVYFAQAASGGPIKIGFSTDARDRRKKLQTAQPDKLVYLAFIPGTREDESAFHNRFHSVRLEGEWFEAEPVLTWLRRRGYLRAATARS